MNTSHNNRCLIFHTDVLKDQSHDILKLIRIRFIGHVCTCLDKKFVFCLSRNVYCKLEKKQTTQIQTMFYSKYTKYRLGGWS